MKFSRTMLLAVVGLALGAVSAQAESLLRQRFGDLSNRVESMFTATPDSHEIKTLKDRRQLKVDLIAQKLTDIEILKLEVRQLDDDLSRLNPDYRITSVMPAEPLNAASADITSLNPPAVSVCTLPAPTQGASCK